MEIYQYRVQGRKPGTYLALGVGMGFAYVCWLLEARPFVWGLLAFYLCIVIWRLAANPGSGVTLTDEALTVTGRGKTRRLSLDELRAVEYADAGEDMPMACRLHLNDGEIVSLPAEALPGAKRLTEELVRRGVPQIEG